MNTLNGYSKSTLTDKYVLTAAGGHLAVGNANKNIPLNNSTLNTNLNADLLDGLHASSFLRYYSANTDITNLNVVNTPSFLHTVSTTGNSPTTITKPSGIDNAWGVLHVHVHKGNYAMQLGFGGTTGNLYQRNAYSSSTFGSWKTILDSSNYSGILDSRYYTETEVNNKLAGYLPLAGGTMNNGAIIKFNANGSIIQTTATTSNATAMILWYKGTAKDANYSHAAQIGWHNTGDGSGAIYLVPNPQNSEPWGGSVGLYIGKTLFKWNNNAIIHAGNYTTYTVKKDGTGASGTWGISITGNAASATTSTYANRLTLNGITNDTTYGTYAGIIQTSANGPESGSWHNSIKILHNNSAGYYTQLAQNFTGTHGLWHRSNRAGTISRWYKVIDDLGGIVYGDLSLLSSSGDSPKLQFIRGGSVGDSNALWDWLMYSSSGHFLLRTDLGKGSWITTLLLSTGYLMGIWTDSPADKLHVNGGYIRSSSNGKFIRIGNGNASYAHYETDAPAHWFNKAVEVNGNHSPHANNSFTSGTSGRRWSNVYSVLGNFSGAVNFANGTWNPVGDDSAIGDCNLAGLLGLKSLNNNLPGIAFYNSSGTNTGKLYNDSGTLHFNGNLVIGSGTTTPFKTYNHLKAVSKIVEWNSNSYIQHVILLIPVLQSRNWSGMNYIDGKFLMWKQGGNMYDVVNINMNCVYNYLEYSLTCSGQHSSLYKLCICTYNGIKYYALDCPYHANPYNTVEFHGYIKSDLSGGTSTVALPLDIPYYDENSQTVLNSEVRNSKTSTLTNTYVDGATSQVFTSHSGFRKSGYDNNSVLLAGGGATAVSNLTPTNYYWANVKISSTSNAATKPTFSNTIVNGVLTVNGGVKTLAINHNHALSTAWNDFIACLNPNLTATYHTAHITFGRTYNAKNVGYIGFKYAGAASNSNMVTIGLHSVDNVLNILASGNVGIGTTSPEQKLHVAGLVNITANSGTLTIGCLNTSWTHYSTTGGTHWFNKAVEVNGSLTPHANTSFNLGSDSKRWSTIYGAHGNFSGTIKMYTGDSALAIYSGRVTDAKSDGNICFLTSINNTDPQSHSYPTLYGTRCTISLQPRGGSVYIGTNPDGNSYKFYVNGTSYLSSTLTMGGVIVTHTGSSQQGIKFGTSYLNSLSNLLLWQSPEAIRFGSTDWDWNAWAGLKYNHSSKIIYLGLADGTVFNANSGLSGGQLRLPGISDAYVGNGTYKILHLGNSSVSGGGSSGGSSITVNIGGTSKTLTIPSSLPANGGSANKLNSANLKSTSGLHYYYAGGITTSTDNTGNYVGPNSNTTYSSVLRLQSHATAGLLYYRDLIFDVNSNYIWSRRVTNSGTPSLVSILHSGNSSVSGGGSSWGSSITVKINDTTATLTIPSNPNTHWTTRIYAGASGTAANAAATNPYLKVTDDNTYRNLVRFVGGGATTVSSDASGNITISSTNTTYDLGISDYTVKIKGTTKNFVRDWGHGAANMNAVARGGRSSMGMADLSTPSGGTATAVNPNGQTSWHHFINIAYTDGGAGSNSWITQIANKAGTTDLWVRSRSGGTISDTANWTAGWTRILTGTNYTNVLDSRYVNTAGDTMTGPLTFANGTWNVVGDDAAIGDYNAAGMLGLKSINNNIPGIGFHNKSNTLLGRLQANGSNLLWNDNKIWHAGNDGSGSGLDADTVDGVHASSLPQIKYIGNTSDFCYDVILLCKRDEAHQKRLDGTLFTTGGGVCRYHCADVHFWHSCWSVGSYDVYNSMTNKAHNDYNFEFCTCTYGGAVWYAIRLCRVQAVSYYFMGNQDGINFSLITYYNTNSGVKNSEIYNSISLMTSNNMRYAGDIHAKHFYESSDIALKDNIKPIINSDNIPQLKSFNWKSDGSHSYGLIALELEEMGYPELVSNSGSHKTVNYSAALSLIVGKLQVKIKELEKEIEILKNKN